MITSNALFVLLYLWLLGPRFVFADLMWLTVFGLALASPLFGAHRQVAKFGMNQIWFLVAFLAIYSVGIATTYGTMDFLYALSWLKALVFAYSAATLVQLYKRRYGNCAFEQLICHTVLATSISAAISLAIFLTPAVREIVNSLIIGTIANSFAGEKGFRIYDLSIGGGTAYGVFNLIVLVILYHHKTLLNPYLRIVVFSLLTVVIFLSARSAFLATVVLSLLGLVFNLSPRRWLVVALRTAAITFIIGIWSIIVLWISGRLQLLLNSEVLDNFMSHTLPWAFELFISLEKGDGPSTATTEYMKEELFFPDSLIGLLFGEGNSDPMSDSGLVRTIFAVGALGLASHLAAIAGFWYVALSHIKFATHRRTLFIIITLLLLTNFKELTFSNSRGLFGIFALYFFAFLNLQPMPSNRRCKISAVRSFYTTPLPSLHEKNNTSI